MRGLVYGSLADFDRGVKHLQMLGVRYYMAWTPEAQAKADAHPDLTQVASIPDRDGVDPKGWKIYEVEGSELVQGLPYEPVVAADARGHDVVVLRPARAGRRHPRPGARRVGVHRGGLVQERRALRHAVGRVGPGGVGSASTASISPTRRSTRLDPVQVTDITEDADKISFHVDEVGVPVVVKESFFPNWEVHGAEGPYRLAPNMMVVIPTENDVSLTYGLTPVDWLGRAISLAGLLGLVGLVVWKGARRYGANSTPRRRGGVRPDDDESPANRRAARPDPREPPPPPQRPEPAPALP